MEEVFVIRFYGNKNRDLCGYSTSVVRRPSKPKRWVRFPLPAQIKIDTVLYAGSNPVLRRMATNRSSILMVLNPVPALLGSCCKIRSDTDKSFKRMHTLGNVSILYAGVAQWLVHQFAILGTWFRLPSSALMLLWQKGLCTRLLILLSRFESL